jgi:hypothetical protein
LAKQKQLKPDIYISSHASQFDLHKKYKPGDPYDPERFVDTATYDDPCRAPDGVVGVWVAGDRVWQDGGPTGARPGRVVQP